MRFSRCCLSSLAVLSLGLLGQAHANRNPVRTQVRAQVKELVAARVNLYTLKHRAQGINLTAPNNSELKLQLSLGEGKVRQAEAALGVHLSSPKLLRALRELVSLGVQLNELSLKETHTRQDAEFWQRHPLRGQASTLATSIRHSRGWDPDLPNDQKRLKGLGAEIGRMDSRVSGLQEAALRLKGQQQVLKARFDRLVRVAIP